MDSNQLKHGIGIIPNREAATQAFNELKAIGFPVNKISVIAKTVEFDRLRSELDVIKRTVPSTEGARAGAITGGTTGGLLTLIAGLGVLLIPGFGPVLAVESVLATLLASGATATVGSLVGALQGWFVPDKQAQLYNERVSQGECLVAIEGTADEIRQAEIILNRWGMQEWHVYESPNKDR